MQKNKYQRLLLLFALFSLPSLTEAQSIGRAEIVGISSNVSASVCTETNFSVKFDFNQDGAPNGNYTLTAQLSNASGVFNGNISQNTSLGTSIYALPGTGNQRTIICRIPAGISAGSNYKIRVVRIGNPNILGQESVHPNIFVSVRPAQPSTANPNKYGKNQWNGFAYGYADPGSSTFMSASIADGLNMFDPQNSLGYFVIKNRNFANTWATMTGGSGFPGQGASGISMDSSFICGTNRSNYALRLRREESFDEGHYKISIRTDDGVKLSVDTGSGLNVVLNQFQEQAPTTHRLDSCKSIVLNEKTKLNLDYYQRKDQSVLHVSILPVATLTQHGPLCTSNAAVTLQADVAGGTFSGAGVSGNTFNPAVAGAGVHKIRYELPGCTPAAPARYMTQKITVFPAPTAVQFSGIPATICRDAQAITLSATPTGGTFSGNGVSGNTFNPAAASIGNNVITYVAGAGSCTSSGTFNISVENVAQPAIQGATSICSSNTLALNTDAVANATYNWTGPNSFASNSQNISIPNASTSNAGQYNLSVTVNGCVSPVRSVNVSVTNFAPVFPANVTIRPNESTTLVASGGTSYTWSPARGLSAANIANPVARPDSTTTYKLTIADAQGCSETRDVVVTVAALPNIVFVPNSFSPNGDTKNDNLAVFGNNLKEYKLLVFNRLGNEVATIEKATKTTWNGEYKGKVLTGETLVWTIEGKFDNGETFKKNGSVVVLK
jgi:gliding motility-associated-like protein